MSKEQAKQLIMQNLTIELLHSFKAEQVDFWTWLETAADLAIDVYADKHSKEAA